MKNEKIIFTPPPPPLALKDIGVGYSTFKDSRSITELTIVDRTKFEAVHDELRRDENVKSREELTDAA